MKIKYFYTDELAAAWQARKFGMVFNPAHERHFKNPRGIMVVLPDVHGTHARYYVHPESLPLLEPQVGDLFRFGTSGPVIECIEDADDRIAKLANIPMPQQWEVSYAREKNHGRIRVLQRNGLAFHWPESEEA